MYNSKPSFISIETTHSVASQHYGLDFFEHIPFLLTKVKPKDGFTVQLTIKVIVDEELAKAVDDFGLAKEVMKSFGVDCDPWKGGVYLRVDK